MKNGNNGNKTQRPSRPTNRTERTIGPVSDLERHLPREWWRSLFNSVYLKTDGDVIESQLNTQREVDWIVKAAGLEVNDRILDLCCGQGRHCLELARRGFTHVTGVDRSRYLVQLARKRARKEGVDVDFHEGDARKLRLRQGPFHCVMVLGNSFGYFDSEEDDRKLLESVKSALHRGGILVMDLADGEWLKTAYEPRSWEWIDQNHFVCRERSLANDGERLISREVVVHAERGVIADQFYAERLYSRERVQTLLEGLGFTEVREHGTLRPGSDRNQDLGMMAKRFLITAQAPVVTPRVTKTAHFPEVTVLLGDPRLPDSVKREGQFNNEDFETIERLKESLAELDQYQFRYFDNHAALFAELRGSRPSFVLNLCDEGFDNDAFKELHVPALLEMLDIPYSGAAPACLAVCYDKSLVRSLAESLEIPVPLQSYCHVDDHGATLPSVFPALVKPNCGDSSLGITVSSVVRTPEELVACVERLQEELPGRSLLIQEFLEGPEYSVGIIGNPGRNLTVLPPLEVDYSKLDAGLPQILGHESKWEPDSPYWNQISYHEASIDEDLRRELVDRSLLLFERLGCRDYARIDFRADSRGVVKLLEVNPNPGWCWDGKLNFMATFAGMRYSDLLEAIVEAAQERLAGGLAVEPPLLVESARRFEGRLT